MSHRTYHPSSLVGYWTCHVEFSKPLTRSKVNPTRQQLGRIFIRRTRVVTPRKLSRSHRRRSTLVDQLGALDTTQLRIAMTSTVCGLRSVKCSSHPPLVFSSAQYVVRWSQPCIGDLGSGKRTGQRRWQTATAVVREEAVDRLNGPPSTRPPPLVTAEIDPNANILVRLVKVGRGCQCSHTPSINPPPDYKI